MGDSAAFDWLARPLGRIQQWWSAAAKWEALVRELENAGEDGARILQELRLNGGDLHHLMVASTDNALLLSRMMAALGLDAEEVARELPAIMRDLERACAACGSKSRCRHDLDSGDAPARSADYCPNKPTLSALQAVTLSRAE
ncbi:MAG TPA: DUF6455 family protein [Beijerinckiaceae bacterium]|nr:DUF6455 family protein [Beijerinckiaceae bacterium]